MLFVHPRWLGFSSTRSVRNRHLLKQFLPPILPRLTATRHRSSKASLISSYHTPVRDHTMGTKTKITRGGGRGSKKPSSDLDNGMNPSGSRGSSKPTHFLCFPIASETTIHRISASLNHWMDATTRPVSKAPHRRRQAHGKPLTSSEATGDQNAEAISEFPDKGAKDEETPNTERPTSETFAESLKILPPIVTRAAGTWHLTLGVMNLANEERMKLALEVLRDLDLQKLLGEAGQGPPTGYKPARKWEDRDKENEGMDVAKDAGEVTVDTEDNTRSAEINTQTQSPPRLTISLTGLGAFPSLRNARVLWARPREQPSPDLSSTSPPTPTPTLGDSTRLYNFALHLIQPFRDAGLITETRSLALHATVANMRFAKSKGRQPAWKCDRVDAGKIARVWNKHQGLVEAVNGEIDVGSEKDENEDKRADDNDGDGEDGEEVDVETGEQGNAAKEFVWVGDVDINRVAICKLGATRHEDPLWREWYPPIEGGERLIFEKNGE